MKKTIHLLSLVLFINCGSGLTEKKQLDKPKIISNHHTDLVIDLDKASYTLKWQIPSNKEFDFEVKVWEVQGTSSNTKFLLSIPFQQEKLIKDGDFYVYLIQELNIHHTYQIQLIYRDQAINKEDAIIIPLPNLDSPFRAIGTDIEEIAGQLSKDLSSLKKKSKWELVTTPTTYTKFLGFYSKYGPAYVNSLKKLSAATTQKAYQGLKDSTANYLAQFLNSLDNMIDFYEQCENTIREAPNHPNKPQLKKLTVNESMLKATLKFKLDEFLLIQGKASNTQVDEL